MRSVSGTMNPINRNSVIRHRRRSQAPQVIRPRAHNPNGYWEQASSRQIKTGHPCGCPFSFWLVAPKKISRLKLANKLGLIKLYRNKTSSISSSSKLPVSLKPYLLYRCSAIELSLLQVNTTLLDGPNGLDAI